MESILSGVIDSLILFIIDGIIGPIPIAIPFRVRMPSHAKTSTIAMANLDGGLGFFDLSGSDLDLAERVLVAILRKKINVTSGITE